MPPKNDQPPLLVYCAEPIDRSGARGWHSMSEMVAACHTWGWGTFRPSHGFHCPKPDPRVEQINREALYRADVLVAYLDLSTPSIGVPAEIEAATARGIPAVVLYDGESQVLSGNPLVAQIRSWPDVIQAIVTATTLHPRGGDAIRLVIREGAPLPRRAFDDDAGIDLACALPSILRPGEFRDLETQVLASQLPPGYWGMILGRSSTLRKTGLHVPTAVIDPGWRGPLYVGVWNLTQQDVKVEAGNRLAQLILIPNHPTQVVQVDTVADHPRGEQGFGSSGA